MIRDFLDLEPFDVSKVHNNLVMSKSAKTIKMRIISFPKSEIEKLLVQSEAE